MADFLTRLVMRHLGLIPVVQPLIASMFASEGVLLGNDSLGFEAQTSSIDSFSEEERNWEAGKTGDGETGKRGDGETGGAEFKADSIRTKTGKMPILQAELYSSSRVGVSPAQALSTSSEIYISKQEDTEIQRTGKIPIPRAETSSSDGLDVSPVQAMDASSSSQPSKLVPSPEPSDSFSEAISAISSEATPIQPTAENQGNRVQPLVELVGEIQPNTFQPLDTIISSEATPIQPTPENQENRVHPLVELVGEIQPNTFQPLDTNRSPNIHEMRSYLPTSSEQQDSSPLTEPSFSQTSKVNTPQNPVANFIPTPLTQPTASPGGIIQRQVDASMRSHSSTDSPANPPNLGESSSFVVEDIPLEQPSPVKPTLPLVSPEAIPSVQPTTISVPSRVELLFNEVLETGQPREHTQYGSDQTSLTPPYEGRRESSFPSLVGEEKGERLTEPDWDNTEVLERDRSTAQMDFQISNLGQRNAPGETQATSSLQASPASEIIQPLRSAESPMSSPIQAPDNQSSRRPNSVQDVPYTAPSSKYSTTPQVQNQGTVANVNSPELPLVRSEIVLPFHPSGESQPSRVEPLINDVAPSVQPTQKPIELDLNQFYKTVQESTNRQQNTPTARSSEQAWGGTEGQMGRRLQKDSSSQPAPTVPSRTFFQPLKTSTGSNPPLRATAQRREFIQLVPQGSLSASQSVPVSGIANGETGRRGDGEKTSVGSLTTGEEGMSKQSFLPHPNVDAPPKSPVNRETLSNIVPALNRKTLSNIIPPLNREALSNIVPAFLTEALVRKAKGDRVMSSTFETPSESSSVMQVQVQSEKLSSLIRRSLSVLSESSSRESRVYPNTNDVPAFPSSNPIYRRNAANFNPTNQLNSVETTPTIQISIGRIEVRASQPPTPPPRTKSAQRGPTQSLQDYLKQRHGGKS
ncbi:hypothetical protein H6F93_00405 [Leptolyngbya sp. FACHB-671]|uniref:hypothetical protein n=1 Tax=Leptolyngbya sp. FACHB-671 TaxID=2692812 RepID=UPI0016859468|nr:hypothetical protein [Leptolyngbya sp. FACHB-671]MBD2066013.1 hypothetical protein [Leptolyngbya sp. FACHB-671]